MKTTFIKNNIDKIIAFALSNDKYKVFDFLNQDNQSIKTIKSSIQDLACDGDAISYLASRSQFKDRNLSYENILGLVKECSEHYQKTIDESKTSFEEYVVGKSYKRVQICASANNFNSGSGMFLSNLNGNLEYLICFEKNFASNIYDKYDENGEFYYYTNQRIKQRDGTYKNNDVFTNWVSDSVKNSNKKILAFIEKDHANFVFEGEFVVLEQIKKHDENDGDFIVFKMQNKSKLLINKLIDKQKIRNKKEHEDNEKLSDEQLHQKALKVSENNKNTSNNTKYVYVRQHERSETIRDDVIRRAHGVCARCGKKVGPDININIPELQCHHVIPLSDGGKDIIDNCVALCPNCHRHVHKYELKKG